MKKIVALLLVVCLLFVGCSAAPEAPVQDPESSISQEQNAVQPETDDEQKEEAAVQPEIDDTQKEETSVQPSDFDVSAVTAEAVDGGVKYTFAALPQTAADITALLEELPRTDAHNVVALFHAALVRYIESPQDGTAMIDVLRGPQPMSDADKSFMEERFSDKKYLPRVYFEGAEPGNDYQPAEPWCIVICDDPVAPPEGYGYVNVTSAGADNPRRIVTRLKDGEHYLWEYNGALLGVRLPASEDPWA